MKLVDILARELKEWPEHASEITQSAIDGELYLHGGAWIRSGLFFAASHDGADGVTRARWQEAREALSKPAKPGAPMPPISEAPKDATHWDPGYDSEPTWACKMGGVWNWHPVNGAPIDSGWRVYPFQGDSLESRLVLIDRPWNGEGLPPVGVECEFIHPGVDHWVRAKVYAYPDGTHMLGVTDDPLWSGEKNKACRIRIDDQLKFRPIRTPEQIAAEERARAIVDLMKTTCISLGEAARIYDAGYRKVKGGEE